MTYWMSEQGMRCCVSLIARTARDASICTIARINNITVTSGVLLRLRLRAVRLSFGNG